MARRLRQASIHVTPGQSLVVPLIVESLPEEIEALGLRWHRKREFHLTALAARVVDALPGDHEAKWQEVVEVASGRHLGPVEVREDLRRVRDSERPKLETLIVMANCPGLADLHRDLSNALGTHVTPPPAHVTLYSTDPAQGIGITDERELVQRAPPLPPDDRGELLHALHWS